MTAATSAYAAPSAIRFADDAAAPGSAPAVLGRAAPRLSWQLPPLPGGAPTAHRLRLTHADGRTETRTTASPEQVRAPWPFALLPSRARGTVEVAVQADGRWTPWSDPAPFETTLLHAGDWRARFVSPRTLGAPHGPAPLIGRSFELPAEATRARLHLTSLGIHIARLNGHRVTDEELAPGWTSYRHRLRFRSHDVTAALRPGTNELTALLGNGWYRGKLGGAGERAVYGDRLALLAQLEVECADGSTHVIATDGTWHAHDTGVLADDLYDGQTTDLRRPRGGPGPVDVLDIPPGRLFPADTPPVRPVAHHPAAPPTRTPARALLYDFGANVVGRVRLDVRGEAGREVTVRHAEVLEDGELSTRPLRGAAATDRYILAGGGTETLDSPLTFHGFRYATVEGVAPEDILRAEAVVLSSDLRPTGTFDCSHPGVRTLHENVGRSMRGNFLDIPTDCPQRDERLGWTGDIQIFAPTAAFLADCDAFLASWLRDLAAEQHPDGTVPFAVPDVHRNILPAAAAWGDAVTVVPWTLYERFGDRDTLAELYPAMRRWVDHLDRAAGEDHVWAGRFQFGDWLDPAAPPDEPGAARTDKDLVATAHFARSARILADTARLLGHHEDAARYARLAADVRTAFAETFATPAGRLLSDTPTAYAMALVWDLLPSPRQRATAGDRLADLVRANGFRMATGFVGTPLITDALTEAGHAHLAYRLLLEESCPSWLYPVTMGATTMWERWDSMLPDGSVNPGQMTSFNHYALGAVADWLHRRVAGLAPAAPGYREIDVCPVPGPGLAWARAALDTPYGRAAAGWRVTGDRLVVEVTVPPGAHATVRLPGAAATGGERVGPGEHRFEVPWASGDGRRPASIREAVDDAALWTALGEVLVKEGAVPDLAATFPLAARGFDLPPERLAEVVLPRARRDRVDRLQEALDAVLAGE
ncbi:family 78 glycoside hydrolase catalytic domain [Streptomyces sp. NPDC049879]|uniref:family 78 glycoside hydrolase catalytic domain n=1 Tax=Streptomyces sp. NPDC049879 TaxID=3365598 RepID=UPI0037A8637B